MKDELTNAGLTDVKKRDATLESQYVVDLLNFITIQTRKQCLSERNEALEQRRKFFKDERWDDYRNIVKDQFKKEESVCQDAMKEVFA